MTSRGQFLPHLVNRSAFVDKIVLSIDGKLRSDINEQPFCLFNRAIYGLGTIYARRIFAECPLTGNPGDIYYGKTRRFANIPGIRMSRNSATIELSGAQVVWFSNQVTDSYSPISVSSLEFAFDLTGATIGQVRKELFHRAQCERNLLDEFGWQTIYVGSPRSAWEARIYQKADTLVRLEFILRRSFLARHGINRPEDVLLLRHLPIWDLLSFRRFSRTAAQRVTKRWTNRTASDLVVNWFREQRPKATVLHILQRKRIRPTEVFRKTFLQRRLEIMQRNFVW